MQRRLHIPTLLLGILIGIGLMLLLLQVTGEWTPIAELAPNQLTGESNDITRESNDRERVLALENETLAIDSQSWDATTGEFSSNTWRKIRSANELEWKDCSFYQTQLGGYVSEVTIIADDEWLPLFIANKDVC